MRTDAFRIRCNQVRETVRVRGVQVAVLIKLQVPAGADVLVEVHALTVGGIDGMHPHPGGALLVWHHTFQRSPLDVLVVPQDVLGDVHGCVLRDALDEVLHAATTL